MKEIDKLKQMSVGLQKGAISAIMLVDSLKMIILNLKIQAAYIDSIEQKVVTDYTIEKLQAEMLSLKNDIKKVGDIGIYIGNLNFELNAENILVLISELETIAQNLKEESKSTFRFLEKLRYICTNLELGTTRMGNSKEARAISVIVKALVREIMILQKSALQINESGEACFMIADSLKNIQKDKVKTKIR